MEEFINYLKYEDREYSIDLLKRYARYIDENIDPDERCKYCKYDTCSEHDDCFDGIFEMLIDKVFTNKEA